MNIKLLHSVFQLFSALYLKLFEFHLRNYFLLRSVLFSLQIWSKYLKLCVGVIQLS